MCNIFLIHSIVGHDRVNNRIVFPQPVVLCSLVFNYIIGKKTANQWPPLLCDLLPNLPGGIHLFDFKFARLEQKVEEEEEDKDDDKLTAFYTCMYIIDTSE